MPVDSRCSGAVLTLNYGSCDCLQKILHDMIITSTKIIEDHIQIFNSGWLIWRVSIVHGQDLMGVIEHNAEK